MIVDLDDIKRVTPEEAYAYILNYAKELGFPATSFQSGSIGYTLIMVPAKCLSISSGWAEYVKNMVNLQTAEGFAVDLIGENHFSENRNPESQTIVKVKIKNNSGFPTIVYDAGTLKLKLYKTTDALGSAVYIDFINQSSFSINANSESIQQFISTKYGEQTRVANDVVPIFDPPQELLSFSSISAPDGYYETIQFGQDKETDSAYKERCVNKWGSLGVNGPESGLKYWVQKSTLPDGNSVNITRISINKDESQYLGIVEMYCADSDGTAEQESIDAAQANVNIHKAIGSTVKLLPAVEIDGLYNLTVYHNGSYIESNLKDNITNAIKNYLGNLPIGGTKIESNYYVLDSEVITAVMEVEGVIDCKITFKVFDSVTYLTPDYQMNATEVIKLSTNQNAAITLKLNVATV